MRRVYVTNAKNNTKPTLKSVVANCFKKTKLNLASLDANQGSISIKSDGNTPYNFGYTNVIFEVSVPTKKFSFKDGDLRVTSATVSFQIIACDCYWDEGREVFVWSDEKPYKFRADEELVHVFPFFKGKSLNLTPSGNYVISKGFEEWDDLGVCTSLIAYIINNSTADEIRAVLDFALIEYASKDC